ncbi:MAG: hypothetical protein ACR2FU_19320 [Streptosporangiaceae bacterium]
MVAGPDGRPARRARAARAGRLGTQPRTGIFALREFGPRGEVRQPAWATELMSEYYS